MKKATELKNWLEMAIRKWLPSEGVDLKKNEQEILNLLFYSNFNPLTTEQSIDLYKRISEKFKSTMDERQEMAINEHNAIQDFKFPSVVKSCVKDPKFDLPLEKIEVDFEIVKPN